MKSKTLEEKKRKKKKKGLKSLGCYKTNKAVYLEACEVARWHNGTQALELTAPVYPMACIIFELEENYKNESRWLVRMLQLLIPNAKVELFKTHNCQIL